MSTLSSRKSNGRRSTRKTMMTPHSPSYDIYCVNFYDNGLRAVRDEFIKQIRTGLRKFLFVIDLDTEIKEAKLANENVHRSSQKSNASADIPLDDVSLVLLRIGKCLSEYQSVTQKIQIELNFNMLKYYQKHLPAQINLRSKKENVGTVDSKPGKKGTDNISLGKIKCLKVTSKEHNTIGKGMSLAKRPYIEDCPDNTCILIVIIGQMKNDFYKELLKREEPLRGVVHFLPEECAYDILVPRPRREKELRDTIEGIQKGIHGLRKRIASKPVGIFQQQLPQMSACQAARYSQDVFDQLSWYLYDMQTLQQQYNEYYVKPYIEIDVQMNPDISLYDSFEMVESLRIQGHYLKCEIPAVHDDDASVYLYLESLLSTIDNPSDLTTEMEVMMLANPNSNLYTTELDIVKLYANAFKSIVKLIKGERLIVEQANPLLSNIISYMDQGLLENIYHACLEYNVLRRYFTSGYILDKIPFTPYCNDLEPMHLPKFAKVYLTDDSVNQRIIQLVNEYDNYMVQEIHPNVKLFTFKRSLNEVFETQNEMVIPTRLCFRDFTLYEMQQFLHDLVTPQMFETAIEFKVESMSDYPSNVTLDATEAEDPNQRYTCRPPKPYNIQSNEFIRPQSLKARKLEEQKSERKLSPRQSRYRKDSSRISLKSARIPTLNSELRASDWEKSDKVSDKVKFIGLGPDHPMLTGYNLDDTRQTIKSKSSHYYFEEGMISLYEEKWNFRHMNRTLTLDIDKQVLHLTNGLENMAVVAPNIRIQTPSGISLRLLTKHQECAKAVLNYPNGLTLYCEDTHAEHLWSSSNMLNEKRRICTPYGCVIIFYCNSDMVLIMRYNGEVYCLHKEYVYEGEGEEETEREVSQSFVNACSTQSVYSSYKPLNKRKKKLSKNSASSLSQRISAGANDVIKKSGKLAGSSTSSATLDVRSADLEAQQFELARKQALFSSIDSELKFLEFITQKFNISFRSLKLTTSLGSVVHVENGDLRCDIPVKVTEWHDYYMNESYAMRDDGVRMVWTSDSLRCYHKDGTLITTTTAAGWDQGVFDDEIDIEITGSSSHTKTVKNIDKRKENVNVVYTNMAKKETLSQSNMFDENMAEMDVEQSTYDSSFTTYAPDSFNIEHTSYAAVLFDFPANHPPSMSNMNTMVSAVDGLAFKLYRLDRSDVPISSDEKDILLSSSEADLDIGTKRWERSMYQFIEYDIIADVKLHNMMLSLYTDRIDLQALLRKHACDENTLVVRDNIHLNVDMKSSVVVAFQNWVEQFRKFIQCGCPKWRTTYFVEQTGSDCHKKGLELVKAVPKLGKYQHSAGNYFLDPVELASVSSSMQRTLKYQAADLAKFPRFGPKETKANFFKFPNVLSTGIYVEIPAQLAYTDRIHLFLEPFKMIKFRKLKHRFNEALVFHVNPNMGKIFHKEVSVQSWRKRHLENKRRNFFEQQRLSLYAAMLKHKVYPNYFQFRDQYHSHVRNIDFFDFMASKCSEKVAKNPNGGTEEGRRDSQPEATDKLKDNDAAISKGRRKKCLCPKYLKSIS